MSNLLSHAEDELNRIGMTEDSPDEMNRMMRKHVLHMMRVIQVSRPHMQSVF
jgi:hypothetical protein